MNDVVIQVEKLGKQYRVGQLEPYKTLRDAVVNAVAAPYHAVASALQRRRSDSTKSKSNNTMWAVRDISFEINRGEVVGVIGRNGAGKTTLLKLLTRITTPTEGRARIRGRVGALLEVTAGFGHPEFTGRENIYLIGAIMGMRQSEIKQKFSEIIEFSGISRYLDTPMKRYSSGMRMRLVFSVAAHLDPEILLIDEVLAVGDVAFQQKCLGKMEDVARGGRTVLFVSHDMSAIQRLCNRSILLENGRVQNIGSTGDIVNEYLATSLNISNIPLSERMNEQIRDAQLIFRNIEFRNSEGQKLSTLTSGEDTSIFLDYVSKDHQAMRDVRIAYIITKRGENITLLDTRLSRNLDEVPAEGRIICNIPRLPLMPGQYSIQVRAYVKGGIVNGVMEAAEFHIKEGCFFNSGLMPEGRFAKVLVDHSWQLEKG